MVDQVGQASPGHEFERIRGGSGPLVDHPDFYTGNQKARLNDSLVDLFGVYSGIGVKDVPISPEADSGSRLVL